MSIRFYSFSQALDNVSPDIICIDGKLLSPDDVLQRSLAIEKMENITSHGKKHVSATTTIFSYKKYLVISLTTEEKDTLGRTTSILVYCPINKASTPISTMQIVREALNLSNRTVLEVTLEDLKDHLYILHHQNIRMQRAIYLLAIIPLLVLTYIIYSILN